MGCSGPDRDVQRRIAEACQSSAGELSVGAIADAPWDRMFVFPPYSTEEDVRAQLGSGASRVARVGIERRDDITLLVFVDQGAIRSFVEQPRTCDFAALSRPGGWPRSATSRKHRKTESGTEFVVLGVLESPAG